MDADWGTEEKTKHFRVQLPPQDLQDPMARPCVEPEGAGDGGDELRHLRLRQLRTYGHVVPTVLLATFYVFHPPTQHEKVCVLGSPGGGGAQQGAHENGGWSSWRRIL